MEKTVVEKLAQKVSAGEGAALVTVIGNSGSSPAKCGAMMLVEGNGATWGTVGGGSLEHTVRAQALEFLAAGKSGEVSHTLSADGPLAMSCGGKVSCFIKVFASRPRLLVVGGGHVGMELYKLGLLQEYHVEIIDDRADFVTAARFPSASVTNGDPAEVLGNMEIDSNCFIAIATHSHELDKMALAAVAASDAAYIGMIGSSRKIKNSLAYLTEQGIPEEKQEKLFMPMGLNVATIQPKEIAVAIMSEILLVKNGGTPSHMRDVKKMKEKTV